MVSQTGVLLAAVCRRAFLIRGNSTELSGFALIIKETANFRYDVLCLQPFAPPASPFGTSFVNPDSSARYRHCA